MHAPVSAFHFLPPPRLLLLVIAVAHLVQCQGWSSETVDPPPPNSWQTITNLTLTNGIVNHEIKSFTIEDQVEINMVIQKNDAELVKDLAICGNIAYTIDSTRIFIEPLNSRIYNAVGLYGPKLLKQTSDTVLNGRKSIAYDSARQVLFYTNPLQSRIEAFNFCNEAVQTVVSRDTDIQINQIAVDADRGTLIWTEAANIDHYRVMMASVHGENITKLFESNSSQCTAMTLNSQAGRVYWVARQQLWSMPYGNSETGRAAVVLHNDQLITDSIQVDGGQNFLYWSSMQRKVLRAPLLTSSKAHVKADNVQLISQLAGQHLLLVAFRVGNAEVGCVPLCKTPQKVELPLSGDGAQPEVTPTRLSGQAVWTEIRHYQWSPKAVAEIVITSAVALLLYAAIALLHASFSRRRRY